MIKPHRRTTLYNFSCTFWWKPELFCWQALILLLVAVVCQAQEVFFPWSSSWWWLSSLSTSSWQSSSSWSTSWWCSYSWSTSWWWSFSSPCLWPGRREPKAEAESSLQQAASRGCWTKWGGQCEQQNPIRMMMTLTQRMVATKCLEWLDWLSIGQPRLDQKDDHHSAWEESDPDVLLLPRRRRTMRRRRRRGRSSGSPPPSPPPPPRRWGGGPWSGPQSGRRRTRCPRMWSTRRSPGRSWARTRCWTRKQSWPPEKRLGWGSRSFAVGAEMRRMNCWTGDNLFIYLSIYLFIYLDR